MSGRQKQSHIFVSFFCSKSKGFEETREAPAYGVVNNISHSFALLRLRSLRLAFSIYSYFARDNYDRQRVLFCLVDNNKQDMIENGFLFQIIYFSSLQ